MNLDDIAVIEGNSITSERSYYEAVQRAINGGEAWKFQGILKTARYNINKVRRLRNPAHEAIYFC